MVKLHVLLADDDADIRAIVALALLRDEFFALRSCASGAEALRTVREWRPDLVLLDVKMPGTDGPTVLARMRADERVAVVPVVFVTARTAATDGPRFAALGAAGVIEKPFDPLRLGAQLRRFVALEGTLAAARENFLTRLAADAGALAALRQRLLRGGSAPALPRIQQIAHALAGSGGIYGFAGISGESAALADTVEDRLAGRNGAGDVVAALDRLLRRIAPADRAPPRSRERPRARRYSAATS